MDEIALLRDQGERENALKEWCLKQIEASYKDFDKLLAAKYSELVARIEANYSRVISEIPQPERPVVQDMSRYASVKEL